MTAIAWALIHFVWQGALLGALAAIFQRLATRPTTRYAIGVAALALMLVFIGATLVQLSRGVESSNVTITYQAMSPAMPGATSAASDEPAMPAGNSSGSEAELKHGDVQPLRLPVLAPVLSLLNRPTTPRVIVLAWLLGVVGFTLRLSGAWIVTRRLATRATRPIAAELELRVSAIAARLSLSRSVRMFESAAAATPLIVGWLRPVVLMPAAVLAGLSIPQVDALVAHELAHLRRHDPLINLLQSVTETLLFYHPVVWWVSRGVRQEREHCCDDLAVSICGDRLTYATALADLAARHRAPAVILAASGGPIVERIARILGEPTERPWTTAAGAPILLAILALVSLVPVVASTSRRPESRPSQPATVSAPFVAHGKDVTPSPAQVPLAQVPGANTPLAMLPFGTTSPASQTPNPALGSIAGTVVDPVTGEPVAGIGVTFCTQYAYYQDDPERSVADRVVTTTPEGRFLFTDVPAGRYHICVAGPGKYLPDYSLRFYEVRPGEAVRGVVKQKWSTTGGVEGHVVDERGQSVAGARLSLVWPLLRDGISQIQRTLDVVSGTDGRFASRVYFAGEKAVVTSQILRFVPEDTLAAGAARSSIGAPWNGFVEVVNEPAARLQSLAAQSRADALSAFPPKPADRPIEFFLFGDGQNRRDLQVQLQSVPAFRLSGRIAASNLPVKNLLLSLERADLPLIQPPMPVAECLVDGTGRFAFLRVPAGRYRIRADTSPNRSGPRGDRADAYPPTVWVDAPIDLRGTVDDLSIDAHRGVSLRGSLKFEGATTPSADVRNMSLTLHTVAGRPGELPVIGVVDGEFTSVELPPGEYLFRHGPFGAPPGWVIKSAIVDGQDMTDVPLRIGTTPPGRVVVTLGPPNPSGLTGIVRTEDGRPEAATVLLFSPDRKYWSHNDAGASLSRTRIAMSSQLGGYLFRDVRPGEYLAIAVPDSPTVLGALVGPDPELFERLAPRATRITVNEGANSVQDLRTQR